MYRNDMSEAVRVCMLEILQQLVDECNYLPHDVVEIILSQFSRKKQVKFFVLSCL